MPPRPLARVGDQSPKPRIVQYRHRRYSIRLEPVFWHALERLAERRQMRLGHLVAELAGEHGHGNFASHLRAVCMIEADLALAQASLRPTRRGLVDLVTACYAPGLLLSRYRTIVAHNDGFLDWLGGGDQALAGADLTSVIQLRTRRPLNEVWLDLVAGGLSSVEANVLHVEPGRVVAAPARILAVRPEADDEFFAVMWLSPRRRGAIEAPARRGAADPHADPA